MAMGCLLEKILKRVKIIEECFTISSNESNNDLDEYNFKVDDQYILVMGFGSIYNHLDDPNSLHKYDRDEINGFRARRFIRKGEEIFISYGRLILIVEKYRLKRYPVGGVFCDIVRDCL